MTEIAIKVCGIPAIAELEECSEPRPMRITGTGFGDAEPADPGDMEYVILDGNGHNSGFLQRMVDQDQDVQEDVEQQIKNALEEINNDY